MPDNPDHKVRVVHYINQFFGGIGGEDKSDIPVEVRDGPVGPGRALQMALGDRAEVVATIICGDDFVAENEDEAGASIGNALDDLKPEQPPKVITRTDVLEDKLRNRNMTHDELLEYLSGQYTQ